MPASRPGIGKVADGAVVHGVWQQQGCLAERRLFNTATVKSKISFIDGDKGILRYRGYPIEQLAEKSTFLEVLPPPPPPPVPYPPLPSSIYTPPHPPNPAAPNVHLTRSPLSSRTCGDSEHRAT